MLKSTIIVLYYYSCFAELLVVANFLLWLMYKFSFIICMFTWGQSTATPLVFLGNWFQYSLNIRLHSCSSLLVQPVIHMCPRNSAQIKLETLLSFMRCVCLCACFVFCNSVVWFSSVNFVGDIINFNRLTISRWLLNSLQCEHLVNSCYPSLSSEQWQETCMHSEQMKVSDSVHRVWY